MRPITNEDIQRVQQILNEPPVGFERHAKRYGDSINNRTAAESNLGIVRQQLKGAEDRLQQAFGRERAMLEVLVEAMDDADAAELEARRRAEEERLRAEEERRLEKELAELEDELREASQPPTQPEPPGEIPS